MRQTLKKSKPVNYDNASHAGLFIVVFPIFCAFLFSPFNGGSIFDEGSGDGGKKSGRFGNY